jgi:integrase
MPIERILSENDIKKVIKANAKPPFKLRNKALVLASTYWLLTPAEASELRLEDVMDRDGQFYRIWVLSAHVAQNGEPREIRTSDHIAKLMQDYMDWWIANGLYETGKKTYQGRDPKAPFILNDNYEKYALSKREKDGAGVLPVALNKKLNALLENAGMKGCSASSFRDSGIKLFYDNGARYNDLRDFTGIKTKKSLDGKIRPHETELTSVMNGLFRNL